MKGYNDNLNTKEEKKPPRKSVNLIFNLILAVLVIAIAFMGYSLFNRFTKAEQKKEKHSSIKVLDKIIQVEILNGSGVPGIAEKITNYLREKNFDVVKTGNYNTNDLEKTLIIDRRDNRLNCEKTADILGVGFDHITPHLNEDYLLDITIVIGRDYLKLTPFNN